MKLDRFYKLKEELETFSFEKNFSSLSKTLYYFSFLGNIFLVLFSYFFIKNVTDSIPQLFPGQGLFFSIFVILFMTGYELFKRFAFEQLTSTILKVRKITGTIFLGTVVCLGLVAGSFYLSLNGAHRLIDTSSTLESKLDTVQNRATDSITAIYQQRITLKEQQIQAIQQNDEDGVLSSRQANSVKLLEGDVKKLEQDRDSRIAAIEAKTGSKLGKQENKVQENSLAFSMMVFFLEFIILIGVGFSAYYKWESFKEMKQTMLSPKYKQLELNLKLLRLYYQNGRKKESDTVIPLTKLKALASNAKIPFSNKDLVEFTTVCTELEIISGPPRKKFYNVSYEKAISLIEKQEIG